MDKPPHLLSIVIPVFRDGERALRAANALLRQSLPDDVEREIILVDDGSDDDTAAHLSSCSDMRIRTLRLHINQGRSAARNAGAAAAAGKFVVFMDCDCIPEENFLSAHFIALNSGAVASTGHVTGQGRGFWSRYQNEASQRRQRQHKMGMAYAGSSQNLAVQRSVFETVGGFDTNYRRYGFEDRDLLLRLSEFGQVNWTQGAIVRHMDVMTLSQISTKMREAGEHSSRRFAMRHPDAYAHLGYSAIDAHMHEGLRIFAPISTPLASFLAASFDSMQGERWLPYFLAKWTVKIASALSYLEGTSRKQ